MCGIAGIITPDRREAEQALARMVPAMVHRGPDDSGSEFLEATAADGRPAVAAFGFRRLAIIDLTSAGHQPMFEPESGNCLVFNGEIYNYHELRAELAAAGCRFRSTSDTEVLLRALGRWGDRALERLEGMYAFAFYRAADRSVLIARDPLGIKPLYVARPGGRLLFASEIRTLLASQLVARDTIFRHVAEFPAGHCERLGGQRRQFWTFPPVQSAFTGDAADLVRRRVQAAVRRHLVADVPVGILLSAGIDSTIIAASAAAESARATAFTVGIGDSHPEDEAAVASATARALGMPHHVVTIESAALPGLWHEWIDCLDAPSIDGFNTWLVTHALARHGIKVGLSGLGADELFGGYPVFRMAPRLQRVIAPLRVLPRRFVARAAAWALHRAGRPGPAGKLPGVLTGPSDIAAVVMGLRRITSDHGLRALGLPLPEPVPSSKSDQDSFNMISQAEITHYMRNTLLRDSDATSMSHSLELRVPFLDLPLVNAVTGLPGSLKQARRGAGKRLLREALANALPPSVTSRRKTGFTLPIGEWILGDMRGFCESAIDACAGLPGMDGDAVRDVWNRYVATAGRGSWTRPFSLVILGSFLRRHGSPA
jgi:asparagine synthase (glutamine-hydrolysing)